MDYVSIILPFIGGLGMFIYGMQIMAQGLENAAGSKMKSLLEVLTKNKFLGFLLGAFITAVIQSSSATTVMVVGFVNAGIMNLTQAMGVIMGANIGTTVTGWLVSSVEWAKALSPANIAPVAVMIGVIVMLTGKRTFYKGYFQYHCGIWYLIHRYYDDVRCSRAAAAVRGILQSVCNTWTQSVPWNRGRCACYSCDSEFICISGDLTESCGSRTGSV